MENLSDRTRFILTILLFVLLAIFALYQNSTKPDSEKKEDGVTFIPKVVMDIERLL